MQTIFGGGAPAAAGAAPAVKDTDTKNFAKDVIEASRQAIVLVDFWAPWCGPCKTLGPLLEKLVKTTKGAVRLVKLNVDQNQQLAAQFRIQSIPAVYAFKDGRPVDGFVGALPESQLKQFMDRLLKGAGGARGGAVEGLEQAVAMAKDHLAKGDAENAAGLYARILEADPENIDAAAGLARAAVMLGDAAQAKEILKQLGPEHDKHADVVAAKAAIELAERAAKAGDWAPLEAKVNANPADPQARYDLALALYAGGQAEAAVTHLLEIFRRNRQWNDDAARKELLKIFEALGPKHEVTLKGRRGLSSLLFS